MVGLKIAKFNTDIHTDLLYSHTGNDVTNHFRSEVIAKNVETSVSED